MDFAWTPHRFAGGALALDVANSVILRFDDKRRTDRFAEPGQLAAFASAAGALSAERKAFAGLAPVDPLRQANFIDLREKIDAHFRYRVSKGVDDNRRLAELLGAIAATLRSHANDPSPCPVDLATARSALKLVSMPQPQRLKICPNCEWLFVDMSRNRSRNWCDMRVCGNRTKARLHYNKKVREDAQ